MATIRKRRKKDGSFSYMAQIRIARRGQPDHSESRTFPKKAMAEEWAKRRELELMQPGGILTAKWRGVTMSDAIDRYLYEFAQGAACRRATGISAPQSTPSGPEPWLVPDLTDRETIRNVVRHLDASLIEHWAVSRAVNRPGNDEDAGLINPL